MIEKEDIPSDKLVNVDEKADGSVTESDEDLVYLKLHTRIMKASRKPSKGSKQKKSRKKEKSTSKKGECASTSGPGS